MQAVRHRARRATFSVRRRLLARSLAASAAVCAVTAATTAPAVAGVFDTYGSTDPVVQWNAYTLEAAKSASAAFNSNVTTRVSAIQSLAARDAVVAGSGGTTLYGGPVAVPAGAVDANVAVAAASYTSAYALSADAAYRASLDARYNAYLAAVPAGAAKANGVSLGQAVANNLLARRASDNASLPYTYVDDPAPAPGKWTRTNASVNAVNPSWGQVTPFLLPGASYFPVAAPPALGSTAYAAAYNEVKAIGAASSASRTAHQTDVAQFWKQDAELPVNQVARQLAAARGLSSAQSADLFARLDAALADARIAVWKVKYDTLLWRPQQAIRRGAEDGNAATDADATWTPLIPIPNHPSYASGHSVTGAAGFEVLKDFFGTDDVTTLGLAGFDVDTTTAGWTDSDHPGNAFYTFTKFSDAAADNGLSRIYGGIHFSFDDAAAQQLGRQVADYIAAAPVPEPTGLGLAAVAAGGAMIRRRRRREFAA